MKKSSLKLPVLFLVLTFTSNLFAGSIFLTPGAKAMGMGGAFVAVADDATAIYWNPAGLTQQETSGVEFSSFYIDYPAKSTKSLGNTAAPNTLIDFPIQKLYPNEPTTFESKKFDTSAVLPFVGGYKRLNDTTVIGAGAYISAGGGGKWSSTVKDLYNTDDLTGKIDAQYGVMIFNVSGAKTLSDKLSLGAGLNLVYMEDQEKYIKTYTGILAPNYNVQIDQKATGFGYEATAGLLYKANSDLNLGMVFRTGAAVSLEGKANVNNSLVPPAHSTDYTEDFRYPMTIGVGASYSIIEKLKLAAEVDFLDYSTMKKYLKYKNNIGLADTNRNANWQDTIMCSLGAEYKCTDNLSLLAGWQLEPSPYPQDKLSLLGTDEYSYNNACVGVQYVYNSLKFALNFSKSYSDTISQNGTSYSYDCETYRFNVGYSFE